MDKKLTINDITLDLESLGINFIPNDGQTEALITIADFLDHNNPDRTLVLSGSAGTGKSSVTKILLGYIEQNRKLHYGVSLATPTHKAKATLKRLSGSEGKYPVSTMHSMLGLRPNVDIVEFDAKNIEFLLDDSFLYEEIPTGMLYIFDESGMIPDDLYDYIIKVLLQKDESIPTKIIFLGDAKQLSPVDQDSISRVFTAPDVQVNLNKVERVVDGNVILETVTELRDHSAEIFETITNNKSGIIVYNDPKEFMRTLRDKYRVAIEKGDTDDVKMLCYTNKRVNQFNYALCNALDMKDPLQIGGFYMGNSNYISPWTTSKASTIYKEFLKPRGVTDPSFRFLHKPSVYNGSDYILLYKEKISINLNDRILGSVGGFYIEMLDVVEGKISALKMLDPDLPKSTYDELARSIERLRLNAIDKSVPKSVRNSFWKYYFNLQNSFTSLYDLVYEGRVIRKADFVTGYALTVHRSQGSSIREVFIDADDLKKCKLDENLRQLQYVACSRAREYIHILQK